MIPKKAIETNVVLTIEDASHCLPALADRVHASGTAALLFKSGRPFVSLVPIQSDVDSTADLVGFLRQWRADHPEPDDQFAEAVNESRTRTQAAHDPWA